MIDLGFITLDVGNLIAILFCMVVFVVQLVLCLKVKFLFVKLIPLILGVIASVGFFIGLNVSEGWDAIGWLALFLYALIFLACIVASWLIYGIIKLITRKKSLE